MTVLLLLGPMSGFAALAQPTIVVSIPPYADLVRRLAGADASVTTLLPPGATTHAFDPSPSDLKRVAEADLVVLNGGVDGWVLDLIAGVGRKVPLFVALDSIAQELIAPVALAEADAVAATHRDESNQAADAAATGPHDHAIGGIDPHVWLDPVLVASLVPDLADALAAADPAGAAAYYDAAERLIEDLDSLHRALTELMAPVAGAPFVPFHDAWSHFAARYGLNLVLEIEPFPGREPSPRELVAAIDAVRATGARVIFNEVQLSDRPAQVLAAEAGVEVVPLDPLGGVPDRERYEDLLRYNAERISSALRGD